MKRSILTAVLLLGVFGAYCQNRKIEIVCEVYEDHPRYDELTKFLPDSLQRMYLVNLRKYHGLENLGVVNVLTLSGWSLAGTSQQVTNTSSHGTYSEIVYHLKREITVTEQEYQEIAGRMKQYLK